MTLCREDRNDLVAGRTMDCFNRHVNSDEAYNFIHRENYPIDKMINSHPQRSDKKRNARQFFLLIFS